MDAVLLVSRMLLAVVFAIAGVAKLADCAGSRQAMIGFGIPARLASPFGTLLPLVEIAIAVMLMSTALAWRGAIGALALLLLFVTGISLSLAHGRKPNCHCFGQLHSAPAGWSTLARNGALASVAVFVIWQGRDNAGLSAVSWLGTLTTTQIFGLIGGVVLLGLLATEGWFLVQLFQQHGRLLMRLDTLEKQLATRSMATAPIQASRMAGLPVNSPAPGFRLPDLDGKLQTLDVLRAANKPIILIFVDPDCGPCMSLLPEVARWQRDMAAQLTIALISQGTPAANRAQNAKHGLTHVFLQRDHEVTQAYQVTGTPTAVLVRADDTLGSPLAEGIEAIGNLVARTVGLPAATADCNCGKSNGNGNGHGANLAPTASVARIGERAPALKLPDLSGKTIDLADFRGSSVLVLFWNPNCGFCARMLDNLKAWEVHPPSGAPKLLVVSTGSVEANRAMQLRSTVVLDRGFGMGQAFGVNGTPSAVLVDEKGAIASSVAIGASEALALAGVKQSEPQLSIA